MSQELTNGVLISDFDDLVQPVMVDMLEIGVVKFLSFAGCKLLFLSWLCLGRKCSGIDI